MYNKTDREIKEMKNLFADKRFSRQAWQSVGMAILQNPACKPLVRLDKDGQETYGSEIERYAYDQLSKDIHEVLKEDRQPTEIEMIMACQIRKARTDTSAATFVRDTVGAKPVDESKVDAIVTNPFESLSDEELAIIANHRETAQKLKEGIDITPEPERAKSTRLSRNPVKPPKETPIIPKRDGKGEF